MGSEKGPQRGEGGDGEWVRDEKGVTVSGSGFKGGDGEWVRV